jgi:hypothetical protein
MNEYGEGERANCPFLIPKTSLPSPVPVYCRLPNGKVRVPTPDQLAVLCGADHYHDCMTFRRWDPGPHHA